MSILDNLKKKSKKDTGVVLKAGIVLLLDNQEQFNKLASLFDLQEDSVCIDGVYVAYMDFYPALEVCPIQDICGEIDNALEAFEHKNLKPMDFDKWYKNIKGYKIIKLNSNQIREIELYIDSCEYSFSINDIIEEYEKYKNGFYVSYSFKQVFEHFSHIFKK